MDQKIYNLENKINIIYDFIYNLNTTDCVSFEKIIIENISIDDIKIPLIDNNKDSKQDIEIYNNYKTDILNTRFKIISFNNDTKQIILKRYSNDYPISIKINFYKYNDTKINSLDTEINNDSLLSYLLSQLILNKQTTHILLPILNIDMLFTDIEHVLKNDDCYDKIKIAINNNEISNICCLQLREQFFKIMVLEDYLSKNKCSHKGLIFQVIHTLAVLQTQYPGFRHNNLLLKNIVIYLKKKNNQYNIYNNFNKKSNEKFYIPNIGFDIKITNFENTIIPVQGRFSSDTHVGLFNINNPNIKFADQPNSYYDIYTFLNDFIHIVKKELEDEAKCNRETIEFLNKIIPPHLRYDKINTSTDSTKESVKIVNNKFNKNYNIISPIDLLNDPYFDEYKKAPDQVVSDTRIISHDYFTGMYQYKTVLQSDNYSVLGHQDNLISNYNYNIMTTKTTHADTKMTDIRTIQIESNNIVKLHRLNSMSGGNVSKHNNEPYQAKLDKLDLSSQMINKPGKKVLTVSSAKLGDTQRASPNESSSFESKDSKSRMLDLSSRMINEDAAKKQYNMSGGNPILRSSSNIIQSANYTKEKHTPFISNDERRIRKSRKDEGQMKEPPVILEQKIYDTSRKSAPKTQMPPAYIPLHDVEGIPHNLLPYTKMINQPPLQKVYNISLSSPFVNHTTINNVYEDTLPGEINALTSTTVSDRCQIITFLRNSLLHKHDGETMNITGGNNSLLSYIKLLNVNPYTKYQYQYTNLPNDFLLYSAAYPVQFDTQSQTIQLSKNAMGINIRIYMMSVGDLLIDSLDNNIKRHHFDMWRELDYYQWAKQMINKAVSPNFITPILYKIDDESHINWEQLKDLKQKNGGLVVTSSGNHVLNNKHKVSENDSYLPSLQSMYSYNKNKDYTLNITKIVTNGNLDITQNSGQSLILLTEAPTTSFKEWFKPQYDVYGSISKMTSTGHHSDKVWKSILFQLIYAMAVLQKSKIYISHFSLDNIYIKDVNINQNSIGSWIYKVDGIDYYIPNYGFVLLIDTTFADVKPTDMPIEIQKSAPPLPNINSDLIPIIAAAYKAGIEAIKTTNNNNKIVNKIVDAAYNEIVNLGNIITPPATTTPNKDPKYYKIYGYKYDDETSIRISKTDPEIIKKLILDQFKNIMSFNTFSSEKTIPPNIITLINTINVNIGDNIKSLIPIIFGEYLHNRVGTPLLVSEKEKIPPFSNFTSRKSGALIIWQSRYDEYKWVIYKEPKIPHHHVIIIDKISGEQTVHTGSLFIYPPSESILPSSTATMKYDETHIFETYNLDNI
jgi:hypothetical protein